MRKCKTIGVKEQSIIERNLVLIIMNCNLNYKLTVDPPTKKATISVREVIDIETPACCNM